MCVRIQSKSEDSKVKIPKNNNALNYSAHCLHLGSKQNPKILKDNAETSPPSCLAGKKLLFASRLINPESENSEKGKCRNINL